MISAQFPLASWFLLIAGALFATFFALPILFAPLKWARAFRWTIPQETPLTVYFARCLGAVALAIVAVCLRAAAQPEQHAALFELIIAIGLLMTLVHIWGAIERTQPWTETLEIVLYVGLTVAAYFVRRSLGG